ncbi:hypothetical protein Tco_1445334, partial [Tanacetum coccineum]
LSSETKLQGRLLASFQKDAKYEHVGQDTRSQGDKDDQDKQGKDLKISKQKTKSKDNDKGSRSKITQHEGTSLQHNKDQRFKNSMTKQSQQDFLLAIPIDGFGQHMSPVEYRTILKYHLMILLFSVDAICPVCRKACLDSFGEHTVHCKELTGFKYLHDMVRNFLFDICRRAGISAKKEAPVKFLTDLLDGRSTPRLADVLVFG